VQVHVDVDVHTIVVLDLRSVVFRERHEVINLTELAGVHIHSSQRITAAVRQVRVLRCGQGEMKEK
jgi:hypothetical protein